MSRVKGFQFGLGGSDSQLWRSHLWEHHEICIGKIGYVLFKAENPLEWSTLSGFHVPMSSSEQGEGFPIWPMGVNYGGHTYGSTTKYVSRKTKTAGIP